VVYEIVQLYQLWILVAASCRLVLSKLLAYLCGNLVVLRTRNRLPTELKLLRSTDLFRHDLKTFLFDSVYGHQDTD